MDWTIKLRGQLRLGGVVHSAEHMSIWQMCVKDKQQYHREDEFLYKINVN